MLQRALLGLLAIASCKGGDHVSDVAPPELQLVSAGAEPRRVLRYRATKTSTQTSDVIIDMEATAGDVTSTMPTLVLTLSIGVEDILGDGRAKLRGTVANAMARDRPDSKVISAGLTAPLAAMKGLVVTALLSPNGRLAQTAIE